MLERCLGGNRRGSETQMRISCVVSLDRIEKLGDRRWESLCDVECRDSMTQLYNCPEAEEGDGWGYISAI